MRKAIKTYREKVSSSMMIEDEDGNDELTIDLRETPLFHPCSNGCLLNPEIYSYAEEATSLFQAHKTFKIHWLFAAETSVEDQQKVQGIFRTHYANLYQGLEKKLTKEFILAILFIFVGFLFLSFHIPFADANASSIYAEILDIFGWVLIWEAGSILFVNSIDNTSELKRDLFFFNADFDVVDSSHLEKK